VTGTPREVVTLFEHGTPDEPGAALAIARRASSFGGAGPSTPSATAAFGGPSTPSATAAFGGPSTLRWYVDPQNLGLLSRTMRDLAGADDERRPRAALRASRSASLDVVLRAEDVAPDRTEVAHERELAPTLRRLCDPASAALPVRLVMTNGRAYALPPPALDISTNDLCGLACNMCGNRAPRRDPHTMLPEEVRALIAEAAAWGIRRVALTGAGEPFRDPEMLGHIRYANGLGHLVTITTNGFPISDKLATDLASRVVSISVSIHGATDETHDAIVGVPKAAENAWRAVRRMVRARDAAPGSKLAVNVSTVIQRQNLAEIPELVRRAKGEGVAGINIQPVNLQHGFFRGDDIVRRDDLLLLGRLWPERAQGKTLHAIFDELEALKREHGSFVHASLERLGLFRRYFENSSRDALGVSCRVGDAFLAVDHRGQIKPCYRLPWSHGDARLTNVRALWNSQAYARTRQLVDACPLTCMNNCFFREKRAR
jgi:MoaA/NifB/PqqE/SkfB family radical SAM enzyme